MRAFPAQLKEPPEFWGMDLRDWFAGLAMQGMLANHQVTVRPETAKRAYYMADVMMEERKKQ